LGFPQVIPLAAQFPDLNGRPVAGRHVHLQTDETMIDLPDAFPDLEIPMRSLCRAIGVGVVKRVTRCADGATYPLIGQIAQLPTDHIEPVGSNGKSYGIRAEILHQDQRQGEHAPGQGPETQRTDYKVEGGG